MVTEDTQAGAVKEWGSPGELPAWNEAEMPAPAVFGWKNVIAAIGPGLIVLGGSIGTGEWLTGPAVTVRFGGQLLWIATLAIIFQSFLNCEAIRYALATGEPVFTGYMRCKPGPRFWSGVYLLSDFGMFLPAFAASLAQLLVAAYLGQNTPVTADHTGIIMTVGIVVALLSFVIMHFGGKIVNVLMAFMTFKIVWVLLFLLFVDLFLVGIDHWAIILRGFFFPFDSGGLMIPKDLKLSDWATVAGFAAFAGAGGLGNATFSNYSREKGWGMGAHVGHIPSAIGGTDVGLSPLGSIFKVTSESMIRWKLWWKYILFDQYAVWVIGCFAGVILPAVMSLRFVNLGPGGKVNAMDVATMQARGISAAFPNYAQLLWILTLVTGFLIIWFTMIQALDHVTRRWTDILWTSSQRTRDRAGSKGVKAIYYRILGVYALVNCGVMVLNMTVMKQSPFAIVILTSVSQGFAMAITAFHTVYVNRRFLPKALQPSRWRVAGTLLCGVFYVTMTALAVSGVIDSELKKRRAASSAAAAQLEPSRTVQVDPSSLRGK